MQRDSCNRAEILDKQLFYRIYSKQDQKIEGKLAYAEADQTAEITLTCTGTEYDPFAQEDAGLGVTILKKMAKYLDYIRKEDRNHIRINL